MDQKAVLDPAASPARPGVRRVNNVPMAILGGAVAVFLIIMAYVAAGRAAQRQGAQEESTVRSALGVAKNIAGDHEAGVVPASGGGDPANSAAASSAAAANARSGSLPALPVLAGGQSGFAAPPPPPRLSGAESGQLLPPRSAQGPGSDAVSVRDGSESYQTARGVDDDERDLHRMKFDMFKQAVRAKTVAMELPDRSSSSSERGDRIAEVRAGLAAAQAQTAGASYIDKLRQLQAAGLLPERPGDDKTDRSDAYAQFTGDQDQDRWALGSRQEAPGSRYELRAGAVIPATLQTGINSDLPGQITAIVAQDVRDTARGRYVLIPQGSRLVGTYGSDVKYGQERVLVAWQRIVWPDGKALDIGAMPGSDGAGYAGFKDQVDTHFWRLLAGALLLSGITGGIAYSQDSQAQDSDRATVSGAMSQALGQQLGQLTEEMIRKQMNVAPTIEIRPGYRFNVQVTKDLTFNAPYVAFDYERSISAGGMTFRTPREQEAP